LSRERKRWSPATLAAAMLRGCINADIVKERIYAVAAQISGVPVESVKNMFVARCSSAYCRCRAVRNIASGDDGT